MLSQVAAAAPGTPASVGGSAVAVLGTITLLLAALVAAWCIAAGIAGNALGRKRLVQSAEYGLYGFTALASLASALIIYGFVTHDFSIKYVSATSDTSMSVAYKVTAFWGGLDGSLLFWVLVLALFSTVAVWMNRRRHRDMLGYVVATIMVVQLFFLALLIFGYSPFATHLTDPPADGRGLNPLLQNYWMVIHPPSLYIGFVAATIPFAFGIGALASGRLDDLWLSSVRSWMLVCFFFLSLGLILGGRWAYEELGWGGYWAWDPVENAGFLPWFTATAFLHSAIIQEQRGMLKVWNLVLVVLTFFLTIFGTFMTRSGVVQSVHAFGEDDELAVQFILFMVTTLIVSFGLIAYRSQQLGRRPQLESFASREFAFLLNNWILLGSAFFVLFATMFPTISEAIDGTRASVGPGFFNRWMTVLGLVLLLLAGMAPLLAWRRTTRERLASQFMWPTAFSLGTMLLLAIALPQTRVLTEVVARGVELPMALVTYGFCAFVWASVMQEFIRGVAVRRTQTGSDAFTSLIGLILTKRRKYGGYIVHAGVAILFLGFTGKAYERMDDRTIGRPVDPSTVTLVDPGQPVPPGMVAIGHAPPDARGVRQVRLLSAQDPAWFTFHDYRFLYEDLIESENAAKSAITARVTLWQDGEPLAAMYPARWDFHKGEQPTTEVAIHSRFGEDVYIVLTGFGKDAQGKPSGMANFRVWKNPLILWVWVGYLTIALGTLVCLLPAGLVNRASRRPTSTIGRAADVAAVVVFLVGPALAIGWSATPGTPHALQGQPHHEAVPFSDRELDPVALGAVIGQAGPPAEHDTGPKEGGGMGDDGTAWASMERPQNPTAASLMKELVCMCGGCQRENLYECKCRFAAEERKMVNDLMARLMETTPGLLDSDTGRKQAYDQVVAAFVQKYGGEHVLSTPQSSLSWLFPTLAVLGGLGLLFVVGRRWVGRGRAQLATAAPAAAPQDQAYADRLDDELRETD